MQCLEPEPILKLFKEVIIGWFSDDRHSTTCDMKERIDMGRKFLGISSLRLGLQMGMM